MGTDDFAFVYECGPNLLIGYLGSILIYLITYVFLRGTFTYSRQRKLLKSDGYREHRLTKWNARKTKLMMILAGKTLLGKFLLVITVLFSLTGSIAYIVATFRYHNTLCVEMRPRPAIIIGVVCSFFFMIMMILRLIVANSVYSEWLTWTSFVDFMLVVPTIFGLATQIYQYALGFLFLFKFVQISHVLVQLHIINNDTMIQRFHICFKLLTIWLASAGMLMFVEKFNYYWDKTIVSPDNYSNYAYFILVTVSTVGYGDVTPQTVAGKVFTTFFIIAVLLSVTANFTELCELFRKAKRYNGRLSREFGIRHVVVCGNITNHSASAFLEEFVKAGRLQNAAETKVVFISEKDPDVSTQTFVQREAIHLTYINGCATSQKDLERADTARAEAVIILADSRCPDPAQEDSENMMRLVAVKNFYPKCRIICTFLLMENKSTMGNIPNWNSSDHEAPDVAICLSQLRLGLIALNCLCRGASTLLTNLIVPVQSPDDDDEGDKEDRDCCQLSACLSRPVKKNPMSLSATNYYRGTKFNLHTVKFSPAFDGVLFSDVVRTASRGFNILPLAVRISDLDTDKSQLIANPGKRLEIDSSRMEAIVIAANPEAARRLQFYRQHNLDQLNSLSPASTPTDDSLSTAETNDEPSTVTNTQDKPPRKRRLPFKTRLRPRSNKQQTTQPIIPSVNFNVDTTRSVNETKSEVAVVRHSGGYFYWVTDRLLTDATISPEAMMKSDITGHIIVCVTRPTATAKLGLADFVMPLRSTRIPEHEIRPIVFLCDPRLITLEWNSLRNFPEIYVLNGSPLSRYYLRAARLERCSTCVVLACPNSLEYKNSIMEDKEAILCTLNIRRIITDVYEQADKVSAEIIALTEEIEREDKVYKYCPQYAAGHSFESNLFDQLSTKTYFDPLVLTFIETLLIGGPSHEVEKVFVEDRGFYPGLWGYSVTSIGLVQLQPDPDLQLSVKSSTKQHSKSVSVNPIYESNSECPITITINDKTLISSSSSIPIASSSNYNQVEGEDDERRIPHSQSWTRTTDSAEWSRLKATVQDLRKRKLSIHRVADANSSFDRLSMPDMTAIDRTRSYSNQLCPKPCNSGLLSYTTERGSSVMIQLAQLHLEPISKLIASNGQLSSSDISYGELFDAMLEENGSICLGLYRIHLGVGEESVDKDQFNDRSNFVNRYVFTFPKRSTPIQPSDQVMEYGMNHPVQRDTGEDLYSLSWSNPVCSHLLCAANILEYFCDLSNPFYDRMCNNEVIRMQRLSPEQLTSMTGIEFQLYQAQEPILFVIRKQERLSPSQVTPLAYYYIINGTVLQAPDLSALLNSRLITTVNWMNKLIQIMAPCARYHPSDGSYSWDDPDKLLGGTTSPSSSDDQLPTQVERMSVTTKKTAISKAPSANPFQVQRTEFLLRDWAKRFPAPLPNVAPTPGVASQVSNATTPKDESKPKSINLPGVGPNALIGQSSPQPPSHPDNKRMRQ